MTPPLPPARSGSWRTGPSLANAIRSFRAWRRRGLRGTIGSIGRRSGSSPRSPRIPERLAGLILAGPDEADGRGIRDCLPPPPPRPRPGSEEGRFELGIGIRDGNKPRAGRSAWAGSSPRGSDPASGRPGGPGKDGRVTSGARSRARRSTSTRSLSVDDAKRLAIVEELFRRGPVEVGVSPSGRVVDPSCKASPGRQTAGGPGPIAAGGRTMVVVITGGARGVTAEVALAMAEAFGPTLVLLGRSPEPTPEPAWLVLAP